MVIKQRWGEKGDSDNGAVGGKSVTRCDGERQIENATSVLNWRIDDSL